MEVGPRFGFGTSDSANSHNSFSQVYNLKTLADIASAEQATFRNSILNAKTIEDQYVNSRHKRRAPAVPQNLTLAPLMKKKAPAPMAGMWMKTNQWLKRFDMLITGAYP